MAWRLIRQRSTNKWLQVIAGSSAETFSTDGAKYLREASAPFGVSAADVELHEGSDDWQPIQDALRQRVVPTLPAGYPICVGVVLAPAAAKTPDLDGFNKALIGELDGADMAAKFGRAKSLRIKFPGFTEPFLRTIEGNESPGKARWRKALWADAVARVGTADEIITATERDAILALAARHDAKLS